METILPISEIKQHLAEVANQVAYGKDRVVVTRRGKPLMAFVSIEDMELLERVENKMDLIDAQVVLKEIESEGAESWESVKKKLNL